MVVAGVVMRSGQVYLDRCDFSLCVSLDLRGNKDLLTWGLDS